MIRGVCICAEILLLITGQPWAISIWASVSHLENCKFGSDAAFVMTLHWKWKKLGLKWRKHTRGKECICLLIWAIQGEWLQVRSGPGFSISWLCAGLTLQEVLSGMIPSWSRLASFVELGILMGKDSSFLNCVIKSSRMACWLGACAQGWAVARVWGVSLVHGSTSGSQSKT